MSSTPASFAGIYWRNEPDKVLRAVALGIVQAVLTELVFDEYVRAAWRLMERGRLTAEPAPWPETFENWRMG